MNATWLEVEAGGRRFGLPAADVMEVAPDLGPTPEARERTAAVAAEYAIRCLSHMIR